jgi:hypothetical protein
MMASPLNDAQSGGLDRALPNSTQFYCGLRR